MPSILNSDDGVVSGTSGLKTTGGNDGVLNIQTNGTNAISISSGQRSTFPTTIGVGGATPSTSGAGITFPATQSASTDANTLDDYEEGTFTATWFAGANGTGTNLGTTSTNRYTKVGRFVSVSFTRSGVGSGNCLSFTGLPFVPQVDGSASGITADSVVFYFDATYSTTINYRGAGDGLFSRGTANYSTT
jgi:hypothetical protein